MKRESGLLLIKNLKQELFILTEDHPETAIFILFFHTNCSCTITSQHSREERSNLKHTGITSFIYAFNYNRYFPSPLITNSPFKDCSTPLKNHIHKWQNLNR